MLQFIPAQITCWGSQMTQKEEMKTQDTGIPQLLACEVDRLSTL